MQIPPLQAIEQLVLRYVKQRYLPHAVRTAAFTPADLRFFARGVAEVSAAFTTERPTRAKNYFNRKEFRSGYLLYFVLSNFPKAWHCLAQIDAAQRFAGRETVRILDLGAGPGTASLAALEYWQALAPAQRLDITAVDQNREILADARALCTARATSNTAFHGHVVDCDGKNLAGALRRERFDIIFAMNVLNEFGDVPARHRIVTSLLTHHLAEDGVLILIEPGLQRTTRELMELRDGLLQPDDVHLRAYAHTHTRTLILAPCPHHDLCPMRRHNTRDWCHFYLDWERPKIIADLDRLIGNKKEYLKYSYLILTAPSAPAVTSDQRLATSDRRYRVVSAPLRSKGKIELLLCPAEGNDTGRLHRIARLDKDRSRENGDLDLVARGDIVRTAAANQLGRIDPFVIARRFQGLASPPQQAKPVGPPPHARRAR